MLPAYHTFGYLFVYLAAWRSYKELFLPRAVYALTEVIKSVSQIQCLKLSVFQNKSCGCVFCVMCVFLTGPLRTFSLRTFSPLPLSLHKDGPLKAMSGFKGLGKCMFTYVCFSVEQAQYVRVHSEAAPPCGQQRLEETGICERDGSSFSPQGDWLAGE